MANEWFRLWHDMVNDPKWKTIARVSGQPISVVLSVALHYMTDASRSVTRGHVNVTHEDVASALDVTNEAIEAIHAAMQGRVMEGDALSGWNKRQPKREDQGSPESGAKSSVQRKRDQREREREALAQAASQQSHAGSREVTLDKDKDKDIDKKNPPNPPVQGGEASPSASPDKPKRERKPRTSLKTFIENCVKAGEKPISGYGALLEYVEDVGLPMEFVQLAWDVFRQEFLPDGTNEARQQADWRKHFLNYVKKGYFRLWHGEPGPDGGVAYKLTTQGLQAQAMVAARRKEAA